MNLLKKWWFWFLLIPSLYLGYMYNTSRNLSEAGLILPFVFAITLSITIFAFLIIGLIVNIIKNKKKNKQLVADLGFWVWLILLLLFILYNFILANT